LKAIEEATVVSYPFPHFFARNVFPEATYAKILQGLPSDEQMKAYRAYPSRSDCDAGSLESMFGKSFQEMVQDKLGVKGASSELRFVRDRKGYSIAPHTDKVKKVLSLLFYLPEDESMRDYGTSVFVPNEQGFKDKEARHHEFKDFTEVYRAPFIPNSCFGFIRSDVSFHGVYPIGDVVRNALLYNLYR
jgi:hypothetical protein